MKRMQLALALVLALLAGARAEEPVHFVDATLKAAIEAELGVPDPTPTDMLGLTHLMIVFKNITDLTGLEYAVNLEHLELTGNRISSVACLATLTHLETLILNHNPFTDLSSVAGLAKLKHLDMHDNDRITNLGPLASLSNLETLILRGNSISDLSPLASLTKLQAIDLRRNRISDLSPLAGLSGLQNLKLSDNLIHDLSPLLGLTQLEGLFINNNPLDPSACEQYIPAILQHWPQVHLGYDGCTPCHVLVSSTPGGTVVRPGEGEFLRNLGDFIQVEAQPSPGYVFSGWSGSVWGKENPLSIRVWCDLQFRANFVSTQTALHVDDDAPGDPAPADPTRSDPAEDGTPEHPFDSIQEAIQVAGKGITILVQGGTYVENLDNLGKDIQLVGAGSDQPAGSPWPIIQGAADGPVLHWTGRDGLPGLLAGLVISQGRDAQAGALLCDRTSVSLVHCLVTSNRTSDPDGAAVYSTDSTLVVTNCTFADNEGGPSSAALTLVNSSLTMTNSILWNDTTAQVLARGMSQPSVRYCAIRGGWADLGNIAADPLFARPGSEQPGHVLESGEQETVWIAGDYHLLSRAGRWDGDIQNWVQDPVSSPCIDAGDGASPVGDEPAPNGGRINLGVYGGTSEASKSYAAGS